MFTPLLARKRDVLKDKLGIPKEVAAVTMIPVGFPAGNFGPTRRLLMAGMALGDRWGPTYQL